MCRVVHNHLWITTTIIPGKWDCGVGVGGGGVIEEWYYYYYYICIVVATNVRPDYVRHLKRAFYTKHMASLEEDARPKKGNGAWWMWSFDCALWVRGWVGWVDRSHIDPTRRLSTSLRTSTQKNKINQKCNCGIERSELVSGSYGNAFLGFATTKGGKKKGRMKNKQWKIPLPALHMPSQNIHIYISRSQRWHQRDHHREAHYTYKRRPYKPNLFLQSLLHVQGGGYGMLRHQCKTIRRLRFGLNRATGRTLCHTHLVNFSVSYVRFSPKVQKMGISQEKK